MKDYISSTKKYMESLKNLSFYSLVIFLLELFLYACSL